MIYVTDMVISAKDAKETSKKYDYDNVSFNSIMKTIAEEANTGGYSILVNSVSKNNFNRLTELGYRVEVIADYGTSISWRL